MFGQDVVERFLHANKMIRIYRAHQLCQEGYTQMFDKQLTTIWSAPNYVYRCGNGASILEVDEKLDEFFNCFDEAPENIRYKEGEKKEQKMREFPEMERSYGSSASVSTIQARKKAKELSGFDDYFIWLNFYNNN